MFRGKRELLKSGDIDAEAKKAGLDVVDVRHEVTIFMNSDAPDTTS